MEESFIIAIDFGTAYSGYAFSVKPREEEPEPRVKFWGDEVGLETPKAPSCILFDEKETFISFGYKARQDYIAKKSKDGRKNYFFDNFKMLLYNKRLNRDLMIKAANGKEMKALKVFAETLKFLKDDALKTINNTTGRDFIASDFTWVLTVPAIWDPSAKQFMREAAAQAGIVKKGNEVKLVIALEPEAASVYCKKLPADGFITESRQEEKLDETPGTQYIVVDCGGGTIDITVHEVLEGGALKELHKASGNDLGGQKVEQKFKECLREIFSGVWDEYEEKYPSEVQRILYDFSLFKRNEVNVEIDCPLNLGEMAGRKKTIATFFEGVLGIEWEDGAIVISKQKLRSFYDESLDGITQNLREIFQKNRSIKYILLVGGFATSRILRTHIIEEFIDDCDVLCPFKAQEAVLRGAVDFGRNPEIVVSRKSAFTYGISVNEMFDKLTHRKDKKFTNKEGEWCQDIFMDLVKIDEDVGWDEVRTHVLTPIEKDQTKINLSFHRARRHSITYVDEEGVEEMGSFLVHSPDTTLGLKRKIELEIKFGFTEMKATGTDKESGFTQTIELDFMTKS